MNRRYKITLMAFCLFTIAVLPVYARKNVTPVVLSIKDRAATVDRITKNRLDTLLPKFMRQTGFDMWIITCNEDHLDPVFATMVPYNAWFPLTQILVFYDSGEEIERLNISITNMQGLHEKVRPLTDPKTKQKETQWEMLARIVKERDPKKIAINKSDDIWAAGALTVSLKKKLVKAIGPEYAARLHSGEKLAILWLETLLDEELHLYRSAVAISHALIAETFSNAVIAPSVTTTDDLVWHYCQRVADLGLEQSFTPSFKINARDPEVLKMYPLEDKIIRPGDFLHCDVGLVYLRYNTDTKENAYVLKRGETDVPEGLKKGLAEGNRLQDIFCGEFKEGLTGNQMLTNILNKAKAEGINTPRVYSHNCGLYLHQPGPLIGLPWEQVDTGPRGEVTLVPNSCFTVELSVGMPIPERDGKVIIFALEQNIVFTEKGVSYLDGRQTKFHLIK